MKKVFSFSVLIVVSLFMIACSANDEGEEALSCMTVADCPDSSSYLCIGGWCTLGEAGDSDSSDTDADTGTADSGDISADTGDLSDSSSDTGDDSDTEGLPDIDNTDSGDSSDTDTSADTGDSGDSDTDTSDSDSDTDTSDIDSDSDSDTDDGSCSENADCLGNPNKIRCDTATGKCVMCLGSEDCLSGYGQSCDLATHECVSDKTCAAAIAKMPQGGNFNWDDGTTQGFTTNKYWDMVSTLHRSGGYSFGQFSGYSDNWDYTSVLQPVDISVCSPCTVNTVMYVSGTVPMSENGYDFLHPTCNGIGETGARNASSGPQSFDPQSPWASEGSAHSKVNSYTASTWTKFDWTLPAECKTSQFVFGLRFSSNSSVHKEGLVVDDLTIAPKDTPNEPVGYLESADGEGLKGWVCDIDAPQKYLLVRLDYFKNGDTSAAPVQRWVYAKLQRPGEQTILDACSETFNHGFEMPVDDELKAALGAGNHSVTAYAVDIAAAENVCAGSYKNLGSKNFTLE